MRLYSVVIRIGRCENVTYDVLAKCKLSSVALPSASFGQICISIFTVIFTQVLKIFSFLIQAHELKM